MLIKFKNRFRLVQDFSSAAEDARGGRRTSEDWARACSAVPPPTGGALQQGLAKLLRRPCALRRPAADPTPRLATVIASAGRRRLRQPGQSERGEAAAARLGPSSGGARASTPLRGAPGERAPTLPERPAQGARARPPLLKRPRELKSAAAAGGAALGLRPSPSDVGARASSPPLGSCDARPEVKAERVPRPSAAAPLRRLRDTAANRR